MIYRLQMDANGASTVKSWLKGTRALVHTTVARWQVVVPFENKYVFVFVSLSIS